MQDSITRLQSLGAWLVRCGADKAALDKAWQEAPWSGAGEAPLVGIIPGRSDWAVVDIDPPKTKGDMPVHERFAAVRHALGDPAFTNPTPSGGFHWWYRLEAGGEPVPNWKLIVGDLRVDNGYVVLWAPERVAEAISEDEGYQHTREGLTRLLSPLRASGGHVQQQGGKRGRGHVEGDRNSGLFDKVLAAMVNDPDPEPAIAKAVKDAKEAGLPFSEIDATVASARKRATPHRKERQAERLRPEPLSDIGIAISEFREQEAKERLTKLDQAAREALRRVGAVVRNDGNDPLVRMRQVARAWDDGQDTAVRKLFSKAVLDKVRGGIDWSQDYTLQWLVPGWVPRWRLAFLYAMGGIGKSRLSVQLALAKALGLDTWVPGGTGRPGIGLDAEPVRVAFVSWEDDGTDMHRMLAQAAHALGVESDAVEQVLNDRLCFYDVGGMGPIWSPGADKHTSVVASVTDAGIWLRGLMDDFDLVFVDPIAAAYGSEENVRTLVRDFISYWDTAAREAQCNLLMLGHSSKEHLVSGSTDWANGVRCVLGAEWRERTDVVNKHGKKDVVARALQLRTVKLNGAVKAAPVWLAPGPDGHGWRVTTRKESESCFPVGDEGGQA